MLLILAHLADTVLAMISCSLSGASLLQSCLQKKFLNLEIKLDLVFPHRATVSNHYFSVHVLFHKQWDPPLAEVTSSSTRDSPDYVANLEKEEPENTTKLTLFLDTVAVQQNSDGERLLILTAAQRCHLLHKHSMKALLVKHIMLRMQNCFHCILDKLAYISKAIKTLPRIFL